jgi:deoxyribodipyrimidine photo-lyase
LSASGTSVVLFTRDLRLQDNPVIAEAVRSGRRVVPLFVLDDALLPSTAPNRLRFLLESLADLRESLRERGADLIVRRGDPVDEALRVVGETGAEALFLAGDASAYAQRREQRLAAERVRLHITETGAVVAPGELVPDGRDHYRVFTPYWRRWRETPVRALADTPRRLRPLDGLDPGRLPGLDELTKQRAPGDLPRGGERAGRRRLENWLSNGLLDYDRARDDLAADGTSRLSPYLHFGCVSPVELVARSREQPGAEMFARQLCWRDFYLQLLAANPTTPADSLNDRGDDWRDDDEALARWRDGQTGFPLVDAGMRQLQSEGWLHNRVRLVVGSFLTKMLYLDWRRGAAVFSDLLVDADVASNVGNWQWVAGTGVDPRPNRVFNPAAQAKRLDPSGEYVRRYVPELDTPDYPDPIVGYGDAKERFLAARA